jgi:hypothetical protein
VPKIVLILKEDDIVMIRYKLKMFKFNSSSKVGSYFSRTYSELCAFPPRRSPLRFQSRSLSSRSGCRRCLDSFCAFESSIAGYHFRDAYSIIYWRRCWNSRSLRPAPCCLKRSLLQNSDSTSPNTTAAFGLQSN